ncbi:MAG: aldo-keto reductase family protein [Planctomycetota bacterium]
MNSQVCEAHRLGRREFLSRLSGTAAGSALTLGQTCPAENAVLPAPTLPTMRLGKHRVSRLIAGSNPISGYSYMGPVMDRHMREYFTDDRIVEFLRHCEREGINSHQGSRPERMGPILRTLRQRGSKIRFICLHAGGQGKMPVDQVVTETRPIAIVHHGGVTDRLFREGKKGEVHDFVKRVRDAGVLAGVSAHNPDCIKRIADEGWEVDLFMTCFYYLTRTAEGLEKMPPVVTPQIGYSFFASDPLAMTEVCRQVDQPCLGFKILAAGRMCGKARKVEAAFKFAFEHLKTTDGVIVGMYPRFEDQIGQNAGYTRRFAARRDT